MPDARQDSYAFRGAKQAHQLRSLKARIEKKGDSRYLRYFGYRVSSRDKGLTRPVIVGCENDALFVV